MDGDRQKKPVTGAHLGIVNKSEWTEQWRNIAIVALVRCEMQTWDTEPQEISSLPTVSILVPATNPALNEWTRLSRAQQDAVQRAWLAICTRARVQIMRYSAKRGMQIDFPVPRLVLALAQNNYGPAPDPANLPVVLLPVLRGLYLSSMATSADMKNFTCKPIRHLPISKSEFPETRLLIGIPQTSDGRILKE